MATDTQNRQDVDVPVTSGEISSVPADVYVAEFVNFVTSEDLPQEAQTFGPAVRLEYEIVEGDYAGDKLDELASVKGGPKAKLRQRAIALRGGQDYTPDEGGIRLVPLLGKRLKLVVIVDENGFNKIESALPVAPPRAAVPAPRGATPPPAAAAAPARRKF